MHYSLPFFFVASHRIDWIDIHENAHSARDLIIHFDRVFYIAHPGNHMWITSIVTVVKNLVWHKFLFVLFKICKKFFIIFPNHHHIQIIIPRNKPPVTYNANQRSICHKIPDSDLFRNRIDFLQYGKCYLMYFLD